MLNYSNNGCKAQFLLTLMTLMFVGHISTFIPWNKENQRTLWTVKVMTVLNPERFPQCSSNGSCWPLYYSELLQVVLLRHLFQTTLFQSSFATRQPIVIAQKTVLILPLTAWWLPLIRTKHLLFRVPRMLLLADTSCRSHLWGLDGACVSSFYQCTFCRGRKWEKDSLPKKWKCDHYLLTLKLLLTSSFFCGKQMEIFWRMFMLLLPIQWIWMETGCCWVPKERKKASKYVLYYKFSDAIQQLWTLTY